MPHRDRQRTDVIVMAMGDRHRFDVLVGDGLVKREAGAAFNFWVRAGIQQQPAAFNFDKPSARANVSVGVTVYDAHRRINLEVRETVGGKASHGGGLGQAGSARPLASVASRATAWMVASRLAGDLGPTDALRRGVLRE